MPTPTSAETYTPFLNEKFGTTSVTGQPIELTLTEVLPQLNTDLQRSFSLFFACAEPHHPQGIYQLSHPVLGPIDLFLTPVRRRRGGLVYEAAFNLLKDEAQ